MKPRQPAAEIPRQVPIPARPPASRSCLTPGKDEKSQQSSSLDEQGAFFCPEIDTIWINMPVS